MEAKICANIDEPGWFQLQVNTWSSILCHTVANQKLFKHGMKTVAVPYCYFISN